ncbi:hypothetical protein GQX74_013696 [Glossina fuscipes]|nr:hypothetical protein GQX74_013696 [Glossina fuscipes]
MNDGNGNDTQSLRDLLCYSIMREKLLTAAVIDLKRKKTYFEIQFKSSTKRKMWLLGAPGVLTSIVHSFAFPRINKEFYDSFKRYNSVLFVYDKRIEANLSSMKSK